MAGNKTLSARNGAALDEWYTQLTDIEAELRHYREQFKGKVVFCNCDDPYESNFFKYFAMNFPEFVTSVRKEGRLAPADDGSCWVCGVIF